MSPLTLYRSSAGSGKTFTLVKAYLQLVLRRPNAYRYTLAVTFTNKATAELKNRILDTLAALANGLENPMQQALVAEAGFNPKSIPGKAQTALNHLLHDYNHFAVSTIDSFFNRVVRAFARELGLPANFVLETDQNRILDAVIDQLMLQYPSDEQLRHWLQNFALEKMREGRSWQIKADLKNLGGALFSEQYPLILQSITRADGDLKGFLGPLMKKCREKAANVQQQVRETSRQILELTESHGLSAADFAGGRQSSILKWVDSLYRDPTLNAMVKIRDEKLPAIATYEDLVAKSKPEQTKKAVFTCADAGLWHALEALDNALAEGIPEMVTAQLIRENAFPFGVLGDLNKTLQAYRTEHEMLLIADLNNLLKAVTQDVDSPFIYEKVGNTFQHFLLDEFQDTSDFQWDNLRPLLINALSAGHKSLIVGDVKQSIYRWRGGNPDMLVNKLHNDLHPYRSQIQEETLSINRRSFEAIIRFNNALFSWLPGLLSQEHGQLGAFIEEAYKDVQQQCEEANRGKGHVRVAMLPNGDEPHEDAVAQPLLDTMRALMERGYRYQDVALLVRDNKQARTYAHVLAGASPAIPVISGNSLMIGQSPKVQLLVHALQYLNDPADQLARACLLNDLYLYHQLAERPDHHARFLSALENDQTTAMLPNAFTEHLTALLKLPLYDLGEALVRIFALDEAYDAYLQRFLDTLLDFSKEQQADVAHFLEWWEEEGHEAAVKVPEGENAVRIETIHKAKGLEFPVVLLPDLRWDMSTRSDQWLWEEASSSAFQELPYWPVKYKQQLRYSYFGHAYEREGMLSTLDTLNVLYVACTRASEALYLWAPNPVKQNGEVSHSKLHGYIYEALQNLAPEDMEGADGEEITVTWGAPTQQESRAVAAENAYLQQPPSNSWRGKLNIRARGSEVLTLHDDKVRERINQGILMHGVLARIYTHADVPGAIEQVFQAGLISLEEKEGLEGEIANLLNKPGIQEWFAPGSWTIRNEQELLLPDGTAYRPDRVLTHAHKARVLDYKTGEPNSAHTQQVRQYGNLLGRIGYTDVKGYLLYLESGRIEAAL